MLSALDSRSVRHETREGRSITAVRWQGWWRRGVASRLEARIARLASAVALGGPWGHESRHEGLVVLEEEPPA